MNEPAVTDDDIPEAVRIGTMPYDAYRGGGNLPGRSSPALPQRLRPTDGRGLVRGYHAGEPRETSLPFLSCRPAGLPTLLRHLERRQLGRLGTTLKLSVPMSLTLGLSGQPFSGPDIGGFLNNTDADLFASWIGFGTFLPFARGHACAGTNDKGALGLRRGRRDTSRIAIERRYRPAALPLHPLSTRHTNGPAR